MNNTTRKRRHIRIRAKVSGTAERPRVSVYRSNTRLIVQLIDDTAHQTLAQVTGTDIAKLAKDLAEAAKKAKITNAVYDRGGYAFHGRVKALAEALNKEGLKV